MGRANATSRSRAQVCQRPRVNRAPAPWSLRISTLDRLKAWMMRRSVASEIGPPFSTLAMMLRLRPASSLSLAALHLRIARPALHASGVSFGLCPIVLHRQVRFAAVSTKPRPPEGRSLWDRPLGLSWRGGFPGKRMALWQGGVGEWALPLQAPAREDGGWGAAAQLVVG